MAQGHRKVVRRSLNRDEWIRIRLAEVEHWRRAISAPVGGWEAREADYKAPGRYEMLSDWRRIAPGEEWGSPDGTFFFRTRVVVPREFKGRRTEIELITSTEMLARVNGALVNAFDPNRSRVPLLERAKGGEEFDIELEAYVRSAPDDGRVTAFGGYGCVQTWRDPELVSYEEAFEKFLMDFEVPLDVAQAELADEDAREFLYRHLDETLKLLDRETGSRKEFLRSVLKAGEYLAKNVYEAGVLPSPGKLALVGHAHVDVAYHWRVRQGIRKNARTAVVQLALMDEYPEAKYCHTQPYVYEEMKEHYPELFSRIKQKVRSGQWELVGGMYVEPDCNVPSGESLVRQCMIGKLFYLREFGVDVDTCWLPDVFGNSWIMPQILARSGIKYFVSNKMSTWNDTNRFPHTNFIWKGVDGTEVASCVPASHFISWLSADQLLANWQGFQEKTEVGESMNMYGFGDGGGGLTREMLEKARRIRRFPGLPETRQIGGKQYLDEAFANRDTLGVWDDELYLEMHRGTSTTKGALKRLNRKCEIAARDAEVFSVIASRFGAPAPRERLAVAWKRILVNQFHDILPGSHTTPVGREAEETYRASLSELETLSADALKAIASNVAPMSKDGSDWIIFNSLGWVRRDVVRIPVDGGKEWVVEDSAGREIPCQLIRDGARQELIFASHEVPPVGYSTVRVREGKARATSRTLKATRTTIENELFRVKLNKHAEIVSLLDKRSGREVIAQDACANMFQLFEDKPGVYEAWDVVESFKDRQWNIRAAKNIRVIESGPVCAAIRFEKEFLNSHLVQTIRVYSGVPRVDFITSVDWREHNKLLKVAFPVSVLARRATYDLSYGAITRPTHVNTSWDRAKFEVCAHQWADLSEGNYGVSLLNDCKYGHDIRGNVMRLSLLRGPIRPDPDSDQGQHEFVYSLYPHTGSWQSALTPRIAHNLNSPLVSVPVSAIANVSPHAKALPAEHSFVHLDATGAHVSALKPAEDGKGCVLRLVELHGGREDVTICFDRKLNSVWESDLLERPEKKVLHEGNSFRIHMLPFQIRTLRIRFR
ncbi:MAG TPA: glycoside hydrolase family 38 C-terminal domain-containing protein [Candidatus Brocadiia bacterium]|nr:glycoside hydrolase family 38 C-terminal domain-containing protein [Candidatus Brocadiia bacterium]